MAPDVKKGFNWAFWGTIVIVAFTGVTAYQAGEWWRDAGYAVMEFFNGTQSERHTTPPQ